MNQLFVNIGDLHDFSNGRKLNLVAQLVTGDQLDVYFTFGIPQIAQTFRQPMFTLQTVSNAPGWFYEGSKEEGYQLGILVPPYAE